MAPPIKRTVVKREELLKQLKELASYASVIEATIQPISELTATLIEVGGWSSLEDAISNLKVLARELPADAVMARKFPPDLAVKKKG